MRNKEKLHEWIDRFNSDGLSGEELSLFLELMNNDVRVREEVLLDKELNTILKETDILDLRKKINKICAERPVRKKRPNQLLLMAASIVILLSLASVLIYLSWTKNSAAKREYGTLRSVTGKSVVKNSGKDRSELKGFSYFHIKKPGIISGDTGHTTNSIELLACYQPDKALENLVGTISRSGSFRLLSPAQQSVFTRESIIWFSWETDYPVETTLLVENNRGATIYESDSNYNQSVYLNASFLDRGLFYFKIMKKDEVVYFGKFTVR